MRRTPIVRADIRASAHMYSFVHVVRPNERDFYEEKAILESLILSLSVLLRRISTNSVRSYLVSLCFIHKLHIYTRAIYLCTKLFKKRKKQTFLSS